MWPLFGLLVLVMALAALGQTSRPSPAPEKPPGLRIPTGDDATRAQRLNEQIDQAIQEDRWNEAIARAEEVLAMRAKVHL
jgi:hypothetical protein